MRKRICALFTAICLLFGLAWNGIALSVSASDFEDVPAGTGIPEGWIHPRTQTPGNTTYSVVADPDDPENQVLKVTQTKRRSSWYEILYGIDSTSLPLTLEYRYKVESGAEGDRMLYLPSFVYGGTSKHTWPLLLMARDNQFAYSNKTSGWVYVEGVDLEVGKWHTVKHIVDIANKTCELYLDGQKVELNSEKFQFTDALTEVNGVTFGYQASTIGTAYLDDFLVTVGDPCEGVTFEETTLNIPMGGAKYLKPVFTPVNSSTKMTYTSSDESVATVDNFGMVFGAKQGTAIITATPALKNLEPIQITVTIGEAVKGTISVTTPDDLVLPVGGHEDLNAAIAFEGDFIVDDTLKYESSAPEVATVDAYGEVLAIGAGTATITVRSMANLGITKEITVTVSEPQVMQTIYVSPNGTGDGTSAAAPTTLDGAAALLAAIDKTSMTGNIEVILADGYYYRSETLKLTDAHGGNNLYSVVFKAAEGANPTIGGGVSIKGADFAKSDMEGVYEYDLSKLGLSAPVVTRQMFVDDVRATRARGEVAPKTVLKNGEWLYAEDGKTFLGFICDNTELLDIKRPQDLEFVVKNHWVVVRCQAESISEVDGRVHVVMGQNFNFLASPAEYLAMRPDKVVYYENAMELLDEPGEWYLNEETQKLYYMPRAWEAMDTVTVTLPIFDNWDQADSGNVGLVTVIGSSSEQQAQNIRFEGITFADTTWLRPNEKGHGTRQNNYLRDGVGELKEVLADAAITVRMANSIQFLDCTFTRLGINAINMYDGVQNSLVQGGHFYDIGGAAVGIGQPDYRYNVNNFNPTDPKKMMKNVDVLNNYIHDVSVEYSAAAISVGFAVDLDLCHNEIFHIPYSGFHIGYGWDSNFDSITKGLNVSENFIHDYMHDGLFDGGGIYLNGNASGWNVASRNYLRNQGEKYAALYADSGTDYWKRNENVIDITETPVGWNSGTTVLWANGVASAAKHDNHLIGNFYAGFENVAVSDETTNCIVKDNIRVADPSEFPAEALEIIAASGLETAYAGLRNNQIERITTAAQDGVVDISLGKTFDLATKFTDGKDKVVDASKAIIIYESLNTDVATVDGSGVITAVADGETTIRIHVVSNDIWDIVEITVYAGDEVAELKLKNQEAEISLTETGGKKNLNAYGITETGREVAFDTVTWSVADDTVVTIDQNGVLTPVAAGETVLTIVGKKGDIELTATYKIVVREGSGFVVDYLDDFFMAENADKWYHKNTTGHWELTEGQRIDAAVSNAKTYIGRKFDDELLTFRMSITDKGNWPSIVLRTPSTDKTVGYGGTGYIVCMGIGGIELHRFNGAARTQLYGSLGAFTPVFGPLITPNPFDDTKLHEVQFGAINEEAGVRLVMYVDGKEIFNCVDTSEDALRDPGYFGLVGYNGDLYVLEKLGPTGVKHNVTLESEIDFSYFVPKSAVAETGLTATILQDRGDGLEDKSIVLDQTAWEEATVDGVDYWRIRYANVAAKEMTDKLTLVLRDATGVLFTDSYSVAEYAKERIENSSDEKLKDLMNAMLHYGAAAQIYFNYKTDDLANEGLAAPAAAALAAAENAATTVKHNLTLESNIDFSFFVPKSAVAAEGLAATIAHDRLEGNDKSAVVAQANWETAVSGGVEYWRIRYTEVAPKEIGDTLTLTITDGNGAVVTDTYTVAQYAQERIQNSSNANMKALMQTLLTYGAAAQVYFGYTAAN